MKNIYCEKCEKIYSIPEDKAEFFFMNDLCYLCRMKVQEEVILHPGEGRFVFPVSDDVETFNEVRLYED